MLLLKKVCWNTFYQQQPNINFTYLFISTQAMPARLSI